MDTIQFLQSIFQVAESGYTQIFALPSTSAKAISIADFNQVQEAIKANAGQNIYFSPGISAQPKYSKLSKDDVSAITALWADIDIYHPQAHAKDNLPKTIHEAINLVPENLPPSAIVHSGYGLQIWWFLSEVWELDTEIEKDHAYDLLCRLQQCIRQRAAYYGWHVDSVPDLPRVMRLPGTLNVKIPDQPVLAQVIEYSDNLRYNPSEIDDILPAMEQVAASKYRQTSFERRPTDGPAAYMLQNCMFMQHCQLNAKTISYGEWLAMLTNLVRAVDGIEAAHAVSAMDVDRYNERDTDKKIDECLQSMNPQNCDYIRQQLGFQGCPSGGCGMAAPCGWSLGKLPQARAKIKAITVPTAETVYQPEVLGALAILEKEAPAEYDTFYQRLSGQVNKNTFRKELAKHKRDQAGFQVIEGGAQDTPVAVDANGEAWLAQFVPDIPINLRLPHSNSNYSRWKFDNAGVVQIRESEKGQTRTEASYVPVIISERIFNIDSQQEKLRIAFKTEFGSWRNAVLPKATAYNAKSIINLANSGLNVTSETSKMLVKWLSALEAANARNIPLRQGVAKMGWRDNETKFIFPGIQSDYTIDIGDSAAESAIAGLGQAGDYGTWLNTMVELRKRPKARFIMAASFAAPLLKILGQRSFLIHNWDNTQGGKSATLHAALSVWGNPEEIVKTFDDSRTSMERNAALFTDLPMGINEYELLNEKRKGDIDSTIYMISEGKGRGRANKEGLQRTVQWRTIALMTGESQITRSNTRGGVFTRLIEVKGGPLADNDLFASSLYPLTARHYGHAGKVFIEYLLASDHNKLRDTYNKTRAALREKYPNKIHAHMDAMACLALADYLACQWIFNMDEVSAGSQSIAMVEGIIEDIITKSEADESERAWEWLQDWLAANEERFDKATSNKKNYGLSLGYVEGGSIYIIRNELIKALQEEQFNPSKVLSAWANAGRFPCATLGGKRTFGIRSGRRNLNNISKPYVIKIDIPECES